MPSIHGAISLVALAALSANASGQQQVVRPPISHYGVDLGTRNMSIPGMPAGGIAAAMMPGGMGGGPTKELLLGLRSTQKVASPAAEHDIPPAMNMGRSLPLLPVVPVAGARTEAPNQQRTPEKPKARMLFYWGCGETIRPGQPKIADTDKMTLAQFSEALRGRAPQDAGWAQLNAQLRWPNEREPKQVPANASIKGEQLVRGSATPEIRFAIGERQDFLAPFEGSAKGAFPGPFALTWAAIPNAQGYFLQATGHREANGEMIIWTSSEVQETGWGLMTYLPNDFLRRMITEKVVLPPDVTNCSVPKDVFAGVQGAFVQTIAYGEELNLVHPPRPADPKVAWEQIWAAKVRVKSIGMLPLGMGDGDADPARNRGRAQSPSSQQAAPAQETKPPNPLDDAADAVNKLKGLFKF